MTRYICFTLFVLIFVTLSASAQEQPTIEVDPGDTPLIITGRLEDGGVFSGNLRLTARGDAIEAFVFLPSDLRTESGPTVIGRDKVKLSGEHSLKKDIPKDFRVEVSGVTAPGKFEGEIGLLVPGRPPSEAVKVPVKFEITVVPKLNLLDGKNKVVFNLVRSGNCVDRLLARLLFPERFRIDNTSVYMKNPTPVPVVVNRFKCVLAGTAPGSQLASDSSLIPEGKAQNGQEKHAPSNLFFPAKNIAAIPLQFDRSAMPPGKYSGSFYLSLEGRDKPLPVSMDLSVRSAPLWPSLFIIVGILIGQLVKFMQGLGKKLAEAIEPFYLLRTSIDRAEPEDREILVPMFKDARRLVYLGRLEKAKTDREAIERRLEALEELRRIEGQLDGLGEEADEGLVAKIAETRALIEQREDKEAAALLVELKKEVTDAVSRAAEKAKPAAMVFSRESTDRSFDIATAALENVDQIKEEFKERKVWNVFKAWAQKFYDWWIEARTELSFWLRPLIKLVFLIVLWLVGLKALYLGTNTAFGADGFTDYLGLILWGMSSDITSRTISDLGKVT